MGKMYVLSMKSPMKSKALLERSKDQRLDDQLATIGLSLQLVSILKIKEKNQKEKKRVLQKSQIDEEIYGETPFIELLKFI